MYYVISVIILVMSILLIFAVLVQNSKGGGLAANFASPNPTMGVRRTADFLEKSTWTLAIFILALSLAATMFMHSGAGVDEDSAIKGQIENAQDPGAVPFSE
ncbi:MAG: preprotein translocase subunit SecG [Prevotellaceae bacterium]|jgi:preprotein translocase subunit SecG|nr:preprotein translocase subunit SecG [Prevotellaceae bacterium]